MSAQRLFIALELAGEVRAALAAWGREACAADPALRAVREEALHVTVHFLGERPGADVAALRAVVAAAPSGAVPLVSAGALWLAPRRPHILSLALDDPAGRLDALHRALGPRLAAAAPGWAADQRPLRPHVTVARVRRGARPQVGAEPGPPELRLNAVAIVLLRSHLGPAGAAYEPLERLRLRTDA